MVYEVTLEKFSGPLQLLLELIEKEDLPITDVSLAKVADDYVAFIGKEEVRAEELADFLVVAAKLLLIKSNAILPDPEVSHEDDSEMLATQLRLYREFVEVARRVEELYGSDRIMFGREKPFVPTSKQFLPPSSVTTRTLADTFANLLKKLEPFFALKEASMRRVVSVQERIRDIQRAVLERARLSFRDVVGGAASRAEIVVSFLALLELMKQRVIRAAQSAAFEEITLKRVE